MKTRTLLLMALGCGVAIMLAGAVFLFRLAGEADVAAAVPIGERARVGDMVVAVELADERDGVLDVTVVIGGVDDPDGASGFRLIASGRPVSPVRVDEGADQRCAATTVEAQQCVVRFDVAAADGTSRVLFFERGDESARWIVDRTG
ncbi:MAG: hypothetical protein ABIP17_06795 [Ilumatobacteraceae bacterium]